MALNLDFTFDKDTYRHFVNGHCSVMHCHHYMALTTQLAEKYAEYGAVDVLREVIEDAMRPMFDEYYNSNAVTQVGQRLMVGAELYSVLGLGKMKTAANEAGEGVVRLSHSHVDEGWIKKWGKREQPVNHFTCGYVAAMFSSAFGKPPRSYKVTETDSIVAGAPEGRLTVKPV